MKRPLVLMAIHPHHIHTTNVTPFEMMTGRELTLPLHLFFHPKDVSCATVYKAYQYMTALREHLLTTFAWAQKALEASEKGAKAYYHRK